MSGRGRRTLPGADRGALERIVKAYDIRGRVGEDLDERGCRALGAAAARVLAEGAAALVLGRDMRPSSPRLAAALAEGVVSQGLDVVDIGLASTDQVYFASGELGLPGAMITASHNPAGDNGVKLCRAGAGPVSIDTGLAEIRRLAAAPAPAVSRPGRIVQRDLTDRFVAHVRSFVDVTRLEGVRVAVDAGNGMAGHLWPRVMAATGVRTTELYFELDGTFPNHPADPLRAENLRDLQREVLQGQEALGLAFDGDADRVFAVDERGELVSASAVGAVVATRLLATEPGATVLHNLICSRAVPEAVVAAGGRPVRSRVGHSFIKAQMARTGAVLGIEHSGHYYFRDNYRADSGIIAALLLLEAVVTAGRPLSEVAAPHQSLASSGELSIAVSDVEATLGSVREAFCGRGACDDLDGLTVELSGAWFNLRPSNTEPVVRLNVEADDEATMAETRDAVLGLLSGTPGVSGRP